MAPASWAARRDRPVIVSEPPCFTRPDSQLVTAAQFYEPAFAEWLTATGLTHGLDRKLWEYCFILQALDTYVGLGPGTRGLGFGVGTERLPAVMARRGCALVVTDYQPDPGPSGRELWARAALDKLVFDDICPRAQLEQQVAWHEVDMNHIPPALGGFDFLWSCGALEHIGGHANGLAFVRRAMDCLTPGGIAVHTTEFTLTSATDASDTPEISFYTRRDLEGLALDLLRAGHLIVLNFERGTTVADSHVDLPPYTPGMSLTVHMRSHVITSIGLIIQKDGLRLDP